jgi:hypothetical protein
VIELLDSFVRAKLQNTNQPLAYFLAAVAWSNTGSSMAEPGVGYGKQTELFFAPRLDRLSATYRTPLNSSRRSRKTLNQFAISNPRLGPAATRVRQDKPLRKIR